MTIRAAAVIFILVYPKWQLVNQREKEKWRAISFRKNSCDSVISVLYIMWNRGTQSFMVHSTGIRVASSHFVTLRYCHAGRPPSNAWHLLLNRHVQRPSEGQICGEKNTVFDCTGFSRHRKHVRLDYHTFLPLYISIFFFQHKIGSLTIHSSAAPGIYSII